MIIVQSKTITWNAIARNHSKFKVEESDMFNKINFMSIFALVLVVLNGIEARRIKRKGNLRGVTTQFSNLSPRQMMMLRKLVKIKQQSRYGRFHWYRRTKTIGFYVSTVDTVNPWSNISVSRFNSSQGTYIIRLYHGLYLF